MKNYKGQAGNLCSRISITKRTRGEVMGDEERIAEKEKWRDEYDRENENKRKRYNPNCYQPL